MLLRTCWFVLLLLTPSALGAQLAAELRQAASRFTQTVQSTRGSASDRVIEGMISTVTPEADESTRQVQRAAVKVLFAPPSAQPAAMEQLWASVVGSSSAASPTWTDVSNYAAAERRANPQGCPTGLACYELFWAGANGYAAGSRMDANNSSVSRAHAGLVWFRVNGNAMVGTLSGFPFVGERQGDSWRIVRDIGHLRQLWSATLDPAGNLKGFYVNENNGDLVPFYARRLQ